MYTTAFLALLSHAHAAKAAAARQQMVAVLDARGAPRMIGIDALDISVRAAALPAVLHGVVDGSPWVELIFGSGGHKLRDRN